MALVDDPKDMILRMFQLQAGEGGREACETFPAGKAAPDSPLGPDDVVFGVFEGRYLFSQRGVVFGDVALPWTGISRVFTTYARGKTTLVVEGHDGTRLRIASAINGRRILQLLEGLARRWSVASHTGLPAMTIEDFFAKATGPDDFAVNLYPQEPRPRFREAFTDLRGRDAVVGVWVLPQDPEGEGAVYAEAIAIVSDQPESYFEAFLQDTRASWIAPIEANDRRKLDLPPDAPAWIVSWN